MCRLTLALLALLLPAGAATAQLDPEWLTKPYQMTLAVHVDEHPLLTPAYVDRLVAEVSDSLERDLKHGCHLEVTRQHPLLAEVLKNGWSALDQTRPIDDQKFHFLRILFQDGQYEIQSRQIDGSTGLVSTLRRTRTPDRLWVSRLAALTVAQDFGLVGRVGEVVDKTVRLTLKTGGGGSAPAGGLLAVRAGEVYALSQIRVGRDGKAYGYRVPDALFYITDVRGSECTGRLFNRFQDPLQKDRLTLEHRIIRLGTCSAPLQVRVVDSKTGAPLPGYVVTASPSGYDEKTQAVELGATNAQGWVRSKQVFRNVAFVTLTQGGQVRARGPMPILDDQPAEFRVTVSAESDALAEIEYRFRRWMRRAGETALMLDEETRQVAELEKQDQTPQAVERAKKLAQRLKEDLAALTRDLEEIKTVGKDAGPQAEVLAASGDRALAALARQAKGLDEYVEREVNPTPAQRLLRQARLLEERAEAEEAIAAYRQSLAEDKNQPAVQARLQKLEAAWQLKGEAHKEARNFLINVWPGLGWDQLEKRLPEADKALRTCESVGDFLTARRLAKANVTHLDRMAAVLGQLSPNTNAEDQEKAEAIARIAEGLGALSKRAGEFVDRAGR